MRVWFTIVGALALAALGGCAHEQQITIRGSLLSQLPVSRQGPILAAQRQVDLAADSSARAEQALDQAKSQRDVAWSEFDAAKARAEAANKGLLFAEREQSGSPHVLRSAEREQALAYQEKGASQAKLDYAERLVALRRAELRQSKTRFQEAHANLTFVEAATLQQEGIDPHVNIDQVARERDRARIQLVQREPLVAQLRSETESLRIGWQEKRHAFNVAQRGEPVLPPTAGAPVTTGQGAASSNPMGDDAAPVRDPPESQQ
jgi:hypothetical protein